MGGLQRGVQTTGTSGGLGVGVLVCSTVASADTTLRKIIKRPRDSHSTVLLKCIHCLMLGGYYQDLEHIYIIIMNHLHITLYLWSA